MTHDRYVFLLRLTFPPALVRGVAAADAASKLTQRFPQFFFGLKYLHKFCVQFLYVDAAAPGLCAWPCVSGHVRTGCLEHIMWTESFKPIKCCRCAPHALTCPVPKKYEVGERGC